MVPFAGRYMRVEELPGRVIRVTRSGEGFDSLLELRRAYSEVNRLLDSVRQHGYALLVDVRDAPSRNDPEFERTIAPLRAELFAGFRRKAVLARTPAGRLQVQRHSREDQGSFRVFGDEQQALAYLGPED